MKRLMLAFSILSMSLTSCFLLSQKPVPQKAHVMQYDSQGYCDNPTLINKSAVDLRIAMDVSYKDGESYITKPPIYTYLKPNDILDTSEIQFKLGTRVIYHMSWNNWGQGDVIKYELRCNDTLKPLPVEISYDNYKRELLFVYESKENKASGLDYEWKYLN